MKIGINTWVWTSPLTTAELERLAPHVKELGYDWIEIPLEGLDDFDVRRGAEVVRAEGLGVSTCAAMGPDRDLIHPDKTIRDNGIAYVKGAIEASHMLGATNLVGPLYSAVGRTWQQTEEERVRDVDLLVDNLCELAQFAGDHGVTLCVEPLQDAMRAWVRKAVETALKASRGRHTRPKNKGERGR